MNRFIEILLGNVLKSNNDFNKTMILKSSNKLSIDNSLFYNINQETQYLNEKNTSNKYRVYGKISPIINKKVFNSYNYFNSLGNKITLTNSIDSSSKIFDFNLDNWSIVLLKTVTVNGKKGQKYIYDNENDFTLNLNKGLPAMKVIPSFNDTNQRKGFVLYYGHNFKVNDKIYITTGNTESSWFVSEGVYTVKEVNGKYIYINDLMTYEKIGNSSTYVPDNVNLGGVKLNTAINNSISNVINVSGGVINALDQTVINTLNTERPDPFKIVKDDFYIRKINDGELLEYYVKTGEVIQVIEDLSDCGFSINPYGYTNKNYFFEPYIDLTNVTNHLGYPVNDLYVSIIKKGSNSNLSFSPVESNFENLIEYTDVNRGIEIISPTSTTVNSFSPKIGDKYYISLCEYSTQNINEIEINKINHRYIYNNILFNYQPFYNLKLKLLSNYIEKGDSNDIIPFYSVYDQRSENYIWRDVYDHGVINENGEYIDKPFMNDCFYYYKDINFFVNIEKNKTIKYNLDYSDFNTTVNDIVEQVNNITKDLFGDLNTTPNDDKPFIEFDDEQC